MSLCPYKNALGVPGLGVHAHVAGIAVFDVAATLLAAWGLSRKFHVAYWKAAAGLFAAGIVLHRLFCVRTTVDRLLFPDAQAVISPTPSP